MANKLFSVTDDRVTILGHTFHTTSHRPPRIIHRVPKIPTMIDGKECDPRTVLDLNGIPLQTMVDDEAFEGKMLKIFSDPVKARDFARSGSLKISDQRKLNPKLLDSIQSAVPYQSFNGFVTFYEDQNLDGCDFRFITKQHDDFTRELGCGVLWWGWINLNDITSSLECAVVGNAELVACEHIHFQGNWLRMPANIQLWTELRGWGWEDIISSYFITFTPGGGPGDW